MTRKMRAAVGVGLCLAILGGSWVGSNKLTQTPTEQETASPQRSQPTKVAAEPGPGAVCMGYADVESGVIQLYPTQPGRVVEVMVKEESEVRAGAPLFRLDDRLLKLQIQRAEAEVKSSGALLSDAKKLPEQLKVKRDILRKNIYALKYDISSAKHLLSRKQELERSGNGNKAEVDAAADQINKVEQLISAEEEKFRELDLQDPQSAIIRAEANLQANQAQLDQAKLALDECTVRAPVDGKVLRLFVHVGEVLGSNPKAPAIQFCPGGPRIIRAEVEQEFAPRVSLGAIAEVQDDSTKGPKLKGKVVRLSDWYTHRRSIIQEPLQFNDVRTIECIIELDEGQPKPRIGQRVRVYISRGA